MNKTNWKKIKSLFETANGLSLEERRKFLDEKCGDDSELRQEVEKLLNSFEEADTSFLEEPAEKEVVSQLLEQKTQALNNQTTGEVKPEAFVAGTVLDERYRIIGLLGKGGMGEVYKAEDLKLNQTVALKFLPEKLAKNEDALRRFIGEVKNARQVSHENVCRVFDIGETHEKPFISMEFIDGDDLSMLLRRIGRLPSERAVEISRQICLGLNAIHKAGILHRDLKPANIIIDSKGLAKITDFGIAGFEADVQGAESRVGTPVYMSPEQITGKEVTQKSDIYSLGLLLYEIFTGKQAVKGDSLNEIVDIHKSETPTNPSDFVENIDPLVEKIIERCLEKNPENRPVSAVQVALALPGGNPLEVALEAGETPTPEMIAAAPVKGTLKPLVALGLLIGFFSVLGLFIYLQSVYGANVISPLNESADVLASKAKSIVTNLGYNEPPADNDFKLDSDTDFKDYAEKNGKMGEWWGRIRNGQPYLFHFHYRQASETLEPLGFGSEITEKNPPLTDPGMINLRLDTKGRLTFFAAVPPIELKRSDEPEKINWKVLFDEAGLDINKYKDVTPTQRPPVFADQFAAWEGSLIDSPDIPVRIEASAYQGKPTFFNIIPPWKDQAAKKERADQESEKTPLVLFALALVLLLPLIGAILISRHNLKKGKADLRSAVKIFAVVFFIYIFPKFLDIGGVKTSFGIFDYLFSTLAYGLMIAFAVSIIYLAIEPFVRRRWSELFISWNRLMSGNFRDPMIGRDLLAGMFLASVIVLSNYLQELIWKSDPYPDIYLYSSTDFLRGFTGFLTHYSDEIVFSIYFSLVILFILLIFSLIFKKKWMSIFATALFFSLPLFLLTIFLEGGSAIPLAISVFLRWGIIILCLRKFGFLALITLSTVVNTVDFSVTMDTGSFYFPTTIMFLAIPVALAVYAFYISTARQSIFKKNFLDEYKS